MWPKHYRDYPKDAPLKKQTIQSGNGICEMHEINGWGEAYHQLKKRKHGMIFTLLNLLFGEKEEQR